ncbi:MAG TPA: lamin tail domain-containing protein [Myxococcota bacterium]|nr:lamin tail domain-containing protein [Myxococcota bacterium]
MKAVSRAGWLAAALLAAAAFYGCGSGSTGQSDDGFDAGETDGFDAGADQPGDESADLDGADGQDGGTIDGRPISPMFGWILFNEVLIDGTAEGDPNGDGDTSHPFEDQFVELVNVQSDAIDLEGFSIIEQDFAEGSPRQVFPAGSSLPAGHALVVFGGGDAPPATASAEFFSANANDPPGLSFGLHLSVPSDSVWLLDAQGAVVDRFCYGSASVDCDLAAATDASLTRSPDLTGDFVSHDQATGSNGAAFSPGTRLDGSPF